MWNNFLRWNIVRLLSLIKPEQKCVFVLAFVRAISVSFGLSYNTFQNAITEGHIRHQINICTFNRFNSGCIRIISCSQFLYRIFVLLKNIKRKKRSMSFKRVPLRAKQSLQTFELNFSKFIILGVIL